MTTQTKELNRTKYGICPHCKRKIVFKHYQVKKTGLFCLTCRKVISPLGCGVDYRA